jgi:hypothetical protein
MFLKWRNHNFRLVIRVYDKDDVTCDSERPPSDIIVLTVQENEEGKLNQQIELVVVKPPKHHLKIMLADFSSEHI